MISKEWLIKKFGASYRTTLTGIGTVLTGTLTGLAALPYQIEDLGMLIPPYWKAKIIWVGGVATIILKIMNAIYSKANNVSGNAASQITVATEQGESVAVIPPPVDQPTTVIAIEPTPLKPPN